MAKTQGCVCAKRLRKFAHITQCEYLWAVQACGSPTHSHIGNANHYHKYGRWRRTSRELVVGVVALKSARRTFLSHSRSIKDTLKIHIYGLKTGLRSWRTAFGIVYDFLIGKTNKKIISLKINKYTACVMAKKYLFFKYVKKLQTFIIISKI